MTAVVKWTFEDYWQGRDHTVTHYYTGGPIDFVVPDSTTVIKATLRGGAGGGEIIDHVSGGGTIVVEFPVTPGETLRLRVGGDGSRATPGLTGVAGGYNGGGAGGTSTASSGHTGGYGGGGASDIRQGGDALANRIAVAAGAGGNSGEGTSYGGGAGGDHRGDEGSSTRELGPIEDIFSAGDRIFSFHTYGGNGATQLSGGAGGLHGGGDGSLGVGGTGVGSAVNGGGGGGGGLYGGGGGGLDIATTPNNAGGGGGGSNGAGAGVVILQNGRGTWDQVHDAPSISLEYAELAEQYVMEINPNDGGAASIQKNILMNQTVGPNRVNILQEGTSQAPTLNFSGVILTQAQLEAMERWFDRRVFIKLTDDLGREYYGVFSKFAPKRQRRASNFWYHLYDAEFTISGYKNASGRWVYGRAG